MEIRKKFFEKYLHDIAIDQLTEDYSRKGYTVSKERLLGDYRADLVAENERETVVIEVKAGKMTSEKKREIAHLGDYVRTKGNHRFLVAIANPPKEKKLAIPNLESLLTEEVNMNLPKEIEQLPYTHKRVETVQDVDIEEMQVGENLILVKGNGIITVELQRGSDGDVEREDGYKYQDTFPFNFNIALEYINNHLSIAKIESVEVDTSSYYE